MKKDIINSILTFITWRVLILVFAIIGVLYLPLNGHDFLGGGIKNYLIDPLFWGHANFDGEHYISVAIHGYKFLEQAFFPIYPLLIRFIGHLTDMAPSYLVWAGLFISSVSFVIALHILRKLVSIDYPAKIVNLTIVLLLLYPTSFYFGFVYTEAIFFLVSILAFYFARKGNWFLAAVFGGISSAVRIYGILLLPASLLEVWQQKKDLKKAWWIFLVPVGLLIYMAYQWKVFGDPLSFYHLQLLVGPQHQSGIVILPRVFWRYIKILVTVDRSNPLYQTEILEFLTGIVFTILPILGFLKKVRWSYLIYLVSGFLMPSIQGSFSSVPRYVLVLFPGFIIMALLLDKLPKWSQFVIFFILGFFLALETALFIRGYWIA